MEDKHVEDTIDAAFEAIVSRCSGFDIEKKAEVEDVFFKFIPAMLFGGPFLLSGLNHLATREIKEQEVEHKKRMKKLKSEFSPFIDASRGVK